MARVRVTVTLKRGVLEGVERLQRAGGFSSRSQAVEHLLTRALAEAAPSLPALVLAGGPKKRVFLGGKNKFAAVLAGRPLVRHVLDHLHRQGITRFTVSVDTDAAAIRRALSGPSLPYAVSFLESEKPRGTLWPLTALAARFTSPFWVVYGDTLAAVDLSDLHAFHRREGALATLALTTVHDPKPYGVVTLTGSRVQSFTQKPRRRVVSYLVSAGYMLFEPAALEFARAGDTSLERDLLPRLAAAGRLCGYPFQGPYLNVGLTASLDEAAQKTRAFQRAALP